MPDDFGRKKEGRAGVSGGRLAKILNTMSTLFLVADFDMYRMFIYCSFWQPPYERVSAVYSRLKEAFSKLDAIGQKDVITFAENLLMKQDPQRTVSTSSNLQNQAAPQDLAD